MSQEARSDDPRAQSAAAKIRAAIATSKARARGRAVPTERYASKLEAEWAQHLELQRRAGAIYHWAYEGMRIKLAGGAYYRPDFFVLTPELVVEFHEVKGHMREAAHVRIKVAASQHPWFKFTLVRKVGGHWETTEVGA